MSKNRSPSLSFGLLSAFESAAFRSFVFPRRISYVTSAFRDPFIDGKILSRLQNFLKNRPQPFLGQTQISLGTFSWKCCRQAASRFSFSEDFLSSLGWIEVKTIKPKNSEGCQRKKCKGNSSHQPCATVTARALTAD